MEMTSGVIGWCVDWGLRVPFARKDVPRNKKTVPDTFSLFFSLFSLTPFLSSQAIRDALNEFRGDSAPDDDVTFVIVVVK